MTPTKGETVLRLQPVVPLALAVARLKPAVEPSPRNADRIQEITDVPALHEILGCGADEQTSLSGSVSPIIDHVAVQIADKIAAGNPVGS